VAALREMIGQGIAKKRPSWRGTTDVPIQDIKGGLNEAPGLERWEKEWISNGTLPPHITMSGRDRLFITSLMLAVLIPQLIPESAIGVSSASAATAGIAAARAACPGGDCRQLAEAFIRVTGGGKVISLVPRVGDVLQTRAGVFPSAVSLHEAVLQGSRVIDPYLGRTFPSIQAFRDFVVGPNSGAQTLVNGQVIR
jgi:hypothetical protein